MQHHTIQLDQHKYNLCIKKSKIAKRITLSYNLKKHELLATIPYNLEYKKALIFVEKHSDWIKNHPHITEPLNFEKCSNINILNETYSIKDNVSYKSSFNIFHNEKIIEINSKTYQHRAKCLIECLKKIAIDIFTPLSENKSSHLGINYKSISVMDQKKWGSCSINGELKYNFRVIMAPLYVVDYLVAHEVAHLKEFNHSKNFWNIVEKLYSYNDINISKKWLKEQAHTLY